MASLLYTYGWGAVLMQFNKDVTVSVNRSHSNRPQTEQSLEAVYIPLTVKIVPIIYMMEWYLSAGSKIAWKMNIQVISLQSINWKVKASRTGSIVINPMRGLLVMGSAGAGKSYFIIQRVLTQHMEKGFSMFVYDFKYEDLSRIAYYISRHSVLLFWHAIQRKSICDGRMFLKPAFRNCVHPPEVINLSAIKLISKNDRDGVCQRN